MRRILTIFLILIAARSKAQKYIMGPGEYQRSFLYTPTHLVYTITTDNTIGGTGSAAQTGSGTPPVGIPALLVTIPANEPEALICPGLHDGGVASIDSGRVRMYGLATNCQMGNGLTTGPTSTYEILTDVNGNQFDSIGAMSAGWGPVSGVPFYAATKWYNAASTLNNAVWFWGNGTNLGLGSCIKPTPTYVGGFGSGKVVSKIYAVNSSCHAICTDGSLWVLGGTDDYPANTGVNATPTTWTQVTLPGGQLAAFMCKGNSFNFVVTTIGHLVFFGEYGWIGENQSVTSFLPITTPTQVDSYFPSAIFPINQMVASHVGYAILNTTTNSLFTGGSNEVGICGTGPSIIWPLYTTPNGTTPYNGSPPEPWNWFVDMGQYLNQCTQICKGANVTWAYLFGGIQYSFYIEAEDVNGNITGAGRDKAAGLPDGIIWADSLGTRIAGSYHMGHNVVYWSSFPDPLSLIGTQSIVASMPGCVDGESGTSGVTPCTFGTDGPARPNTNLHCNLVVTPTPGGFNWSVATSTTDAGHKLMWTHSFITQTAGTAINIGVPAGKSGSVIGVPAGTYSITDTLVDNAWDTVAETQSFTVGQSGYYFSAAGSGTACTISAPCPPSYVNTVYASAVGGDTLYFNRGDVFPIQIVANVSGSSGNPIVTKPYGTGNLPVIGGRTALTGWTNVLSNVWEVVYTGPQPNILQHNDTILTQTTFPDLVGGWLTPTSMNTTTITDATHAGMVTIGSKIMIRSSQFTIDTAIVSNVSGGVITFAPACYNGTGANGWKVMNITPYENGQYQDTLGQIRIYSVGSPTGTWTIPTVDTPLLSEGTYQEWDSLRFQGGNNADIILAFQLTGYNTFNADSVTDAFDGFQLRSEGNLTVKNTVLRHFTDNGIWKTNNNNYNNSFINDIVYDAGMHPGLGRGGANQGYSGVIAGDSGSIVLNCTVDSIGYIGIGDYGSGFPVDSNFIYNFCQTLEDGGAIYTYQTSGSWARQRQILNNIIINGGSKTSNLGCSLNHLVAGIYTDNYTQQVLIQGNGINFVDYGFYDHGPTNTYYKNVVLNARSAQMLLGQVASGPTISGIISKYNVFGYATPSASGAYSVEVFTNANNLSTFGSIDSNYYLVPFGITASLYTLSSVDLGTLRSIASWRTNTGFDANTQYLNYAPLSFVYSINGSPQSIYGIYRDVYSNQYNGSITTGAYLSAILQRLSLPVLNSLQGGRIIFH